MGIPAISINEAVSATIKGIKREDVLFTIPGYLHYVIEFVRLLPQYYFDKFFKVFYTQIVLPEKEEKTPTTTIIADLATNKIISKCIKKEE